MPFGVAQNNETIYDFFGGKSFANKTIFYRLQFQINNGKVTGYAFTDEQGDEETKSIINGTYNPKNNRISFSETKKLHTRSTTDFNNLCFLEGQVFLKIDKKISKIKGGFFEQTKQGKKCRIGKIELMSPDDYDSLVKIKSETPKDLDKVTIKIEEHVTPKFITKEKITIKDNEKITIFWNSNKVKLDVWDDMKQDNDKITIVFNDEIVLDKFVLKNKKERLDLVLKKGKNKLVFTANNTGFIANNTARIDLFDDTIKHQIITELQLNKSVIVYIIK
jgi:hypothetical protein